MVKEEGADRAQFLLKELSNQVGGESGGADVFCHQHSQNSIRVDDEPRYPGDFALEKKSKLTFVGMQ